MDRADAIGQLILAHYKGLPSAEVIERDDRWFGLSTGASAYFAAFDKWPSVERRAVPLVRGRVLDVGMIVRQRGGLDALPTTGLLRPNTIWA